MPSHLDSFEVFPWNEEFETGIAIIDEQHIAILGNNNYGIVIYDIGSTGNKIVGNYIGTDVNGTADLGNTFNGIRIYYASGNTVGGTTTGERNIIAGNDNYGIGIRYIKARLNDIGRDQYIIGAFYKPYHCFF